MIHEGTVTHLESIGFAGRDGCVTVRSKGTRMMYLRGYSTYVPGLEHPVALSIVVDLARDRPLTRE